MNLSYSLYLEEKLFYRVNYFSNVNIARFKPIFQLRKIDLQKYQSLFAVN